MTAMSSLAQWEAPAITRCGILNLQANPSVTLQVGPDIMAGKARTADASERRQLWPQMAGIWPEYDTYQKKAERGIPIVIIDADRNPG